MYSDAGVYSKAFVISTNNSAHSPTFLQMKLISDVISFFAEINLMAQSWIAKQSNCLFSFQVFKPISLYSRPLKLTRPA